MTTNKVVIKDTITGKYYCVPMTDVNTNGELAPGNNDFPFWSNVQEAYNFLTKLQAENELKMNDLTEDGTRNPVVELIN